MIHENYDVSTVKQAAIGHWKTILCKLGNIPEDHLDGRGHPCPVCREGTDRFNAGEDIDDTGSCFCRQCKLGGDGFNALQKINQWDFQTALKEVGRWLNIAAPSTRPPGPAKQNAKLQPRRPYHGAVSTVRASIRSKLPAGVTIPDEPLEFGYKNAAGSVVGVVLRWNRSDGQKEIRPLSKKQNRWISKAMEAPQPLYKLPQILEAETIYLVEGEKSVEAMESFGLVATTSAGGSNAANKADWSVLSDKRVIICRDHDLPGEKYRDQAAELISQQAPSATIHVAELSECWPEIPAAGDVADWSEHFDSKPAEWFRSELERIAKPIEFDSDHSDVQSNLIAANEFQPLDLSMLPDAFSSIVGAAAPAMGVDPAFLLMPILAVCAAAIGQSRQLMIKQGWYSPCILWTAVVGESGSGKSPAFRVAVQPLKDIQREHSKRYAAERDEYDSKLPDWKRKRKTWEKKGQGQEPEPLVPPTHSQVMTSDCTVEGLAPVLSENERGIILARDELSNWLTSFDKYSGKGATSSNVTNWLEFYNAEFSLINRKSIEQRVLTIARPSVSVTGGIQPGILARCLTPENKDNGLSSRLMLAYPPRQPKRWRDEELSQTVVDAYSDLIRDLFKLDPFWDIEGNAEPQRLRLSPDARQLMAAFVDAHGKEQNALQGHTASQWSKLEEIPARLAIIIHCVKQVTSGVDNPLLVDGQTMAAAIHFAEWLKTEALRINRLLTEDEEIRNARHLADWIATNHAGRITAAKLRDYRRDIETTQQAELLLISLVGLGFGRWQDIHKSREFVLQSA